MVTKYLSGGCKDETLSGCITNMYTPHLKRFPVHPTYIAAGGVVIVPDV